MWSCRAWTVSSATNRFFSLDSTTCTDTQRVAETALQLGEPCVDETSECRE